jgi:hypothetical protein
MTAFFPMGSEAARKGRVRALAKEAARNRARLKHETERQAKVQRLCLELRMAERTERKPPQLPEERERRRAAAAHARDTETARLNLAIEARRALANFRYNAETVRLRDEYMFSPDDAYCRGRELPALNENGAVPGIDATGRVLALINDRLVYVRRTRLFASLSLIDMWRLAIAVEKYPAEAEHMAIVHEARALFWDTLRAMRALDREHGLGLKAQIGGGAP